MKEQFKNVDQYVFSPKAMSSLEHKVVWFFKLGLIQLDRYDLDGDLKSNVDVVWTETLLSSLLGALAGLIKLNWHKKILRGEKQISYVPESHKNMALAGSQVIEAYIPSWAKEKGLGV